MKTIMRQGKDKKVTILLDNLNIEEFDAISKKNSSIEKIAWALKVGKTTTGRDWLLIREIYKILALARCPMSNQLILYTIDSHVDLFVTKRDTCIAVKLRTPQLNIKMVNGQTEYSSVKELVNLIEGLGKEVAIVDPYIDVHLLDIMVLVNPTVFLKVLTINTGGDLKKKTFVGLAERLSEERGNLEIRETDEEFHDRYLIGDKNVLVVGASIKDLGKKDTTIVSAEDLCPIIKKWFAHRWSNAKKVV